MRILRILINAGCEIDKTEKTFGMTALDLAILNGDVESAAVLISNGGNPDHFPQMLSLKVSILCTEESQDKYNWYRHCYWRLLEMKNTIRE